MPLPQVLLFTTPTCPHCPGVKRALGVLVKEALIVEPEVVDLTIHPERAQTLGVKTVPWFRIGELEFEGAMSLSELRSWAARAASASGMQDYFLEMLKSGRRAKVEQLIRRHPERAAVLGDLLLSDATSMAVRIGIGAVLEELQGSGLADAMVPQLVQILLGQVPLNRADAAHYLSLIANPAALDALRRCLDDADATVREIAQETLH